MILELSGKKVFIKDFTMSEKEFIKRYEVLKPWRVMADKYRLKALKTDYKVYAKHKVKKKEEEGL